MAGHRRKHPKKELEQILRLAEEESDWHVEASPSGYFKLKCHCEAKHIRWVHLTPSDPNYGKNLLAWLRRQPCWKETR